MGKLKKIVALLLAAMLVLGASVLAENGNNGEILFRGMPWLMDVDTFAVGLCDELRDPSSYRTRQLIEGGTGIPYWPSDFVTYIRSDKLGEISTLNFDGTDALFCFDINSLYQNTLVAGYPILWIEGFAFAGVENGVISDDPSLSQVVYAEYHFYGDQIEDNRAAFDALCNKLTYLYGEPYTQAKTAGDDPRILWMGANNTYAALHYSVDLEDIVLGYGRTDIPDMAAELQAIGVGGLGGL